MLDIIASRIRIAEKLNSNFCLIFIVIISSPYVFSMIRYTYTIIHFHYNLYQNCKRFQRYG